MVDVVGISSCLHQSLHDVEITLSGGVEKRCLAITVNLVSVAASLDEDLGELVDSVSGNVEQTRLAEVVQLGWVTLAHIDEVFSHIDRLPFILDLDGCEQSILVELVVDEQRNVIRLDESQQCLLLFELFNAALLDKFENDLCDLFLQIHGGLHSLLLVLVVGLRVTFIAAAFNSLLPLHKVLSLLLGKNWNVTRDLGVNDDTALIVLAVHLVVIEPLEVLLVALVVLEVVLLVAKTLNVGHVFKAALVLVVLALVSVVSLVV